MGAPVGTFVIEDAFNITGRGLVVAGVIHGEVAAGYQLVLSNGDRWTIKGVNYINAANRQDMVGLLVDAPVISRQELLAAGIIGSTAQLFASPLTS